MRLSVHDITVVQTEKLSSNSATTAKSSLISSASTFKGIFPQPSQQHYQYHQYSDAMNSTGLSDHTDHPSLIYDHRTSTSSHLRNFKTDKFYGDSVSESMKIPAEIVQTATVPLQFPCTSENFTRFSTTNPSGPPDFVIPVERTIFNG
ncbi:unnamed protein product [Acanthocheilonema viteae]|uniref:Uncharacterized protein n=1 Tax=Acanthocheilonema viteae TaxID=6277 RepID=A0A498SW24_ACAVI|nr:unnamed protein product [Acanthocheilonema viteae]